MHLGSLVLHVLNAEQVEDELFAPHPGRARPQKAVEPLTAEHIPQRRRRKRLECECQSDRPGLLLLAHNAGLACPL